MACTAFASCSITGPSTVTQGEIVTYNITWNGGTPPYGAELNLDARSLATRDGITGTSTAFTVIVDWAVGSYHIFSNVFYQCPDGTFQTCTSNDILINTVASGTGYNCISPGNCQPAPFGTTGTYPDILSCNIGCPMIIGGCDPVACPSTTNYCVSGNCIPKIYVIGAAVGYFALTLLKR